MAKRWNRYGLFSILIFTCMTSAPMQALAQDAKLAIEKWRPREGTYASPGKGFAETCGEFGDLAIALREKSVSGHEWGCKIGKLTDIGPGAIKIEMTCSDYNLAEDLKKPEETEFEEVILLKKIDGKSMSVRKTIDGKFKDPEWRAVYCPTDAQRMYVEAIATNRAEAEKRAADEKREKWQPRDGAYANPGADFDDRCANHPDLIVRLPQSAVTIGATSCYVAHALVNPPSSVTLNANCEGLATTVALSKIDDQSLLLRKSGHGQAAGPDQQLRYCPETAQRAYNDSKKVK